MKTLKDILVELKACSPAMEWAGNKTIEEVIEKCFNLHWLYWLCRRIKVEDKYLILYRDYLRILLVEKPSNDQERYDIMLSKCKEYLGPNIIEIINSQLKT